MEVRSHLPLKLAMTPGELGCIPACAAARNLRTNWYLPCSIETRARQRLQEQPKDACRCNHPLGDQLASRRSSRRFRHERFRMHLPVADFQILPAEPLNFRLVDRFAVGGKPWFASFHALSRVPVHYPLKVNHFRPKVSLILGRYRCA